MSPLRTEADLLRALESSTYTVQDLYRRAEQAGLTERPGARDVIQDGKEQYKRRCAPRCNNSNGRAGRIESMPAARRG